MPDDRRLLPALRALLDWSLWRHAPALVAGLTMVLACSSKGSAPSDGEQGRGGAGASAGGQGLSGGGDRPSGGTGSSAGISTGGVSENGGAGGSTGTAVGGASPGGSTAAAGAATAGAGCVGPVGAISGALATGVAFLDDAGERVNAHGGGIIREGDTFYLHGEYFLSTTTDNNFHGFAMYSSKDLATWKNEGLILPEQASGELGPNRKGGRSHVIKCPSTGEFVLYAHAASLDYQTDKEVVFATSATVNGTYATKAR